MTQLYVTRGSLPARLLYWLWVHSDDVLVALIVVAVGVMLWGVGR